PDQAQPQDGRMRRARGRSGLDRLLPPRGPRLRVVLAVPRADRPARRGPGHRDRHRAGRLTPAIRVLVAGTGVPTPDPAAETGWPRVLVAGTGVPTPDPAAETGWPRVLVAGTGVPTPDPAAETGGGW